MSREEKKRAAKKQKEERAAANRVRFGRTGAEKKLTKFEQERTRLTHDGKRRDEESDTAQDETP